MTHWVISDTHFDHTNIIKYCNRPFSDVKEMDNVLLNNINDVVKTHDILWHLGDFIYGRSTLCLSDYDRYLHYTSFINCKNIILILGNHDDIVKKTPKIQQMFLMVLPYFVGYLNGQAYTLSHYPSDHKYQKYINQFANYNKPFINLFGHVHNNSHNNNPYNISVEQTNYKPVKLKDIL